MRCLAAHATHPDAGIAARLALACLQAQWQGPPPSLGLVYVCDRLAPQHEALQRELQAVWPQTCWVGAASVGVLADGAEYLDEPGLALFVADPPTTQFQPFDGAAPLPQGAAGDLVLLHADPSLPEPAELIAELAARAAPARLFGGLAASRTRALQLAGGAALGAGLSGLHLRAGCGLRLGFTQGCQPLAAARQITQARGHLVLALDEQAALPRLLDDLGLDPQRPQAALPALRGILLGLRRGAGRQGPQGLDALDEGVRVRHLLGLDLQQQALAMGEPVGEGEFLIPCQRHAEAALRDLRRMATQLRAEVEDEGRRIAGAVYISCAGRGGPHFGAPHAEAQLLRHALGEVPTIGFFAGGEVLDGTLYGYSGVLAAFTAPA